MLTISNEVLLKGNTLNLLGPDHYLREVLGVVCHFPKINENGEAPSRRIGDKNILAGATFKKTHSEIQGSS